MNKYKSEFHQWIIEEWDRKNRPEVWVTGNNNCRLWEHKCGRFYVKQIKHNCDKPK